MRFETLTCPTCGEPAVGTIEELRGVALFTDSDESGNVEYEGETKLWWDEQHTVMDDEQRVALVCEQGHDWWTRCTHDDCGLLPGDPFDSEPHWVQRGPE